MLTSVLTRWNGMYVATTIALNYLKSFCHQLMNKKMFVFLSLLISQSHMLYIKFHTLIPKCTVLAVRIDMLFHYGISCS